VSVGLGWQVGSGGYQGVGEDKKVKAGNAMRLMPIFLSEQFNDILY
jgi:hypothetical protein